MEQPALREAGEPTYILQEWTRPARYVQMYAAAISRQRMGGRLDSENKENAEAAGPHGARSVTDVSAISAPVKGITARKTPR